MSTTIQTIKEAEEKLIDKFSNIEIKGNTLRGKCSECKNPDVRVKDSDMKAIELGVFKDFKSHITQTLLAVFESELENLPYAGNETHTEQQIVDDENYPQEERGVVTERLRIRSHLTEVINYLKQK